MAQEYVHRLTITGPELSDTYDLPVGTTTLGRQQGNEIRLNHPMVSRKHAQIDCTATACHIRDLGSANGTSVNGQPLAANAPTPLSNGDTIEIGTFQLSFEQVEVVIAEAPPPPEDTAKMTEEPVEPAAPPPSPPTPPPTPPPPPPSRVRPPADYSEPPPGLSRTSSRYLDYLPGIYHTDFMARFLAIFESVLTPIEWNVDNFDMYLNPETTPPDFLPWLAYWFSITFDPTWSEEQRRLLLSEAHEIFARRGTRWALSRVLEIYTGVEPEIVDLEEGEDPFTFTVKLPLTENEVDRDLIEQIVDTNKPAHTNYTLLFNKTRGRRKKQ